MTTDTITLPRSVVEQALEALNASMPHNNNMDQDWPSHIAARRTLRAALEQPQDHPEQHLDMVPAGWKAVPVQPTDFQIRAAQYTWWHACNCETYWDQIYAAMIAAAPQPPVVERPQVEQEPVAYMTQDEEGAPAMLFFDVREAHGFCGDDEDPTPLYTHPQPKRQPLTVGQINRLIADGKLPLSGNPYEVALAIERAHGIGGES